MNEIEIKTLGNRYQAWVNQILLDEWGSNEMVSRGVIHQVDKLPGFVALVDSQPNGLITYNIEGEQCEIVTLNSLLPRQGVGRGLVNAVRNIALSKGCKRIWLITTNDNTYAFKFYQKLRFTVAAYHLGAIEESRKLKPGIPHIGLNGIHIRDEIELEMVLE